MARAGTPRRNGGLVVKLVVNSACYEMREVSIPLTSGRFVHE